MSEQHERVTARPLPPGSGAVASPSRRRLIKGAAAAPAVFTLYSGAARANLSTYHCIVGTTDVPESLHVVESDTGFASVGLRQDGMTEDGEQWPQDVLDVIKVGSGTGEQHLVKYASGDITNTYYGADAAPYVVTSSDPGDGSPLELQNTFTSEIWQVLDPDDTVVYTYWLVDDQGDFQWTDPGDGRTGRAIMNSCWASIYGIRTV